MMKPQFKRVENYIKPGKWHWLKAVLWSVITLRFFIDLIRLLAYYSVNCIVGRQQATIGKNCKIHPTVMLRQPTMIKIGDHFCYPKFRITKFIQTKILSQLDFLLY